MSKKLQNLIKKFGEDPTLKDQFKKNPEAVMEAHGLSEEHKELIRKGDKEAVQKEAGASDAHMNFIIF